MTTFDLVPRLRAAGCVFAEDEAAILLASTDDPAELQTRVARRVAGEPLEVIVGWAEFRGLRIGVTAGVFVPRQRTALLVDRAVALLRPGMTVLDLCCGTGAIGMAVAAAVPGVRVLACDVEPAAVACARANLTGIGEVFAGDLFDALPGDLRGRIDVIAVNAPYVPAAEIAHMPPEARDFEPRVTLDGGADGMDVHRRIAADAADWLTPGGTLLIESSVDQAPVSAALFAAAGLARTRIEYDDVTGGTVVVASR